MSINIHMSKYIWKHIHILVTVILTGNVMIYLTPYMQRLVCYHTLMREDVWKLHLLAGGDRTALKDLVVS